MCGLTGFLEAHNGLDAATLEAMVRRMADTLTHRGPDDSGAWVDAAAGIALGFRRLAIVDLSAEGHQPMRSADGRFVLAFNGEIYNFGALKSELIGLGHRFRGGSDTEVMLAAFCQWGVEPAVKRFVGMFGFALWDRQERILRLARDRMGEKPLYYGWSGDTFLFGSELKALCAHPKWRGEIDRDAIALQMRYNYIPSPYSIYRGIHKMNPGTLLTLTPQDVAARRLPDPQPYWSLHEASAAGLAEPFSGSDAEAVQHLDALLRQSIAGQMVADVPLGAFLSGGVDSSTIVALMQAQSDRPVRTFTIGFHESGYNEAAHANAVACHLKTDHTEIYVTPEEAQTVIPRLPTLYDEPFSDSSQIPTFLVSQLARQHVTVSLSGDGGDELFCGYQRYHVGNKVWRNVAWMPAIGRRAAARALLSAPPGLFSLLGRRYLDVEVKRERQEEFGHKMRQLADILTIEDQGRFYRRMMSHWKQPEELLPGSNEPPTPFVEGAQWNHLPDLMRRMMYLDMVAYLPDDILVKVDRASMGVSLESRVPLLDHRVVEFAWRLPQRFKVRDGQSKWLLRQVLYRYVPREMIERPKQGFGIPIGDWLRGPLRDWAEALLAESRLRAEDFFAPAPIRKKWEEHLSNRANWQYYLWDVLMFQAWLEARGATSSPAPVAVRSR